MKNKHSTSGGKKLFPPIRKIFNSLSTFSNLTKFDIAFILLHILLLSVSAYKTMYFEAHVCFLLYHFHCTKSQEGSKTSLLQWMKENFLSYYFPPRIYAKRRLVIKAWIIRRISPLL